jgi:hypothetical protein
MKNLPRQVARTGQNASDDGFTPQQECYVALVVSGKLWGRRAVPCLRIVRAEGAVEGHFLNRYGKYQFDNHFLVISRHSRPEKDGGMGCLSAREFVLSEEQRTSWIIGATFAALLALSAALLAAFSHSIHVADAFTRKEEQVMVSRYLEGRMRG